MVIKCKKCRDGMLKAGRKSLGYTGDLNNDDRFLRISVVYECNVCDNQYYWQEEFPIDPLKHALQLAEESRD